MFKKIHHIFIFLLFSSILSAQKSDNIYPKVNENIFVHLNTATVFTGETIYFKIYCFNENSNTLTGLSKIAYIELMDPEGNSVDKQKIELKEGVGYNDIFLPPDLFSGNYKVIAYTKAMLNAGKIFESDILVINPYKTLKSPHKGIVIDTIAINSEQDIHIITENQSELYFDKPLYNERDKVILNLDKKLLNDTDFVNGNYSISVRKKDPTDKLSYTPVSVNYKDNMAVYPGLTSKQYLPEVRGEILSGRVIGEGDLYGTELALSVPGEVFDFKLANSDGNGVFYFILDSVTLNNQVQLQIVGQPGLTLVLDSLGINYSVLKTDKTYHINTALINAIDKRAMACQIENAYFEEKRDTLRLNSQEDLHVFYKPLNKTYILDDFNRFPTFRETVIEILPELFYKKRKGNYSLHIRSLGKEEEGSLYGETLVLVDGMYLMDVNQLFDYDPKNIEKIDIVNSGYYYGNYLFNGIVAVYTKNRDFKQISTTNFPVFIKKILRPVQEKIYYKQTYSDTTNPKIPDYRYQLYWNPIVDLSNINDIAWFTGDLTGSFQVIFEGFKADGTPVYFQNTFNVE